MKPIAADEMFPEGVDIEDVRLNQQSPPFDFFLTNFMNFFRVEIQELCWT